MLSQIISSTEGIKLTDVMSQITNLVPVVLPAVIGFIAFRKGWKFLRGALGTQ